MGFVVAVGADNAGVEYKNKIKADLEADPRIEKVIDLGVGNTEDQTAYPHTAVGVARLVADGQADRAILVCGTGIGVCISANKVPGIRAALTHDTYSAERAALSNNAHIITMGARVIGPELAKSIADAFLAQSFDEAGRSASNVEAINAVEAKYAKAGQ